MKNWGIYHSMYWPRGCWVLASRLSYLFSQWVLDLKMARIWELSKGFYRGGNPEAPAQTFVLLVDCRVKSTLVQFLY